MPRFLFRIFFIFLIGALGGIFFQAFLLPYFATKPFFQKFQFIKILTEREVKIFPKEEIFIQENIALQKAVEKVEKVVIGVKTQTKKGKVLAGSGIILTSDGIGVTVATLLPSGSDFSFYWEEEKLPFQILKRDLKNNLALVKMGKGNFPTVGFSNLEKIKLGQRVFFVGIIFEGEKTKKVVNEGILKTFDENILRTNIFEKTTLSGSPLFDIEGNLLGVNIIDEEGKVLTIPITKIKEFAGL